MEREKSIKEGFRVNALPVQLVKIFKKCKTPFLKRFGTLMFKLTKN